MNEVETMKSDPLVSVIMPAYNCECYIEQAIDSILDQAFPDFELLIIDDSSTDNTWSKIIQYKDPRITATRNTVNLGYLKTTNLLFDLCKGELIAFQDADDWSAPKRLEKQRALLQSKYNIDLCGTYTVKHYPRSSVLTRYPSNDLSIRKSLRNGRTSLFCGASIMFNRNLLDDIGPYNEFYNRIGAEDIDWYLRALEKYAAYNIPEKLYHYRQHETSITNNHTNPLSKISIDIAYAAHKQRQKNGTDSIIETKNFREKIEILLFNTQRIKPNKKSTFDFFKKSNFNHPNLINSRLALALSMLKRKSSNKKIIKLMEMAER